jgi:hypothetical protein
MLFEGMTIRGINNPGGDREAIGDVLASTLRFLLSDWSMASAPDGSVGP